MYHCPKLVFQSKPTKLHFTWLFFILQNVATIIHWLFYFENLNLNIDDLQYWKLWIDWTLHLILMGKTKMGRFYYITFENRNDTYDCGWANMNASNEWNWYQSDFGWAYLNGAPNNLKMILIEQTRMNYDCNWARFRLPMIWNWYYIKRKATLKLNWFWLSKPWWCSQ